MLVQVGRRNPLLPCAGLFAVLAASPAAAQPGTELEIGGGFHAPFLAFGDLIELPAVPTVDVRIVRWTGEKWGVSGRAMVGFGSNQPDEVGVLERRNPMHFQAFVRYRTEGVGDDFMEVGIGAGWTLVKTVRRSFEELTQGPHLFALEALRATTLTERLTLKVGASLGPLHVHPVVLFAWK